MLPRQNLPHPLVPEFTAPLPFFRIIHEVNDLARIIVFIVGNRIHRSIPGGGAGLLEVKTHNRFSEGHILKHLHPC